MPLVGKDSVPFTLRYTPLPNPLPLYPLPHPSHHLHTPRILHRYRENIHITSISHTEPTWCTASSHLQERQVAPSIWKRKWNDTGIALVGSFYLGEVPPLFRCEVAVYATPPSKQSRGTRFEPQGALNPGHTIRNPLCDNPRHLGSFNHRRVSQRKQIFFYLGSLCGNSRLSLVEGCRECSKLRVG